MSSDLLKNLAIGDDGSGAKTNMLLPGVLTLTVFGLVGFHYGTSQSYSHSMLHFLSIILLQMFPLMALKLKIYQCGDRLALVPRTLVKTLLMHLLLSGLRILPPMMVTQIDWYELQLWLDVISLVGVVVVLIKTFGYQFSLKGLIEEKEVRNLIVMSVVAAMLTETFIDGVLPKDFSISELTRNFIQDKAPTRKFIFTLANYVDVVAFMPVVLKLYEIEAQDDERAGMQVPVEVKQQVLIFFCYVVGFYSWDDVVDPIRDSQYDVSMMAHAAHFMLLLDFACFFTFQVWTPSSTKGEQMQGLLEQGEDDY